jgi:hypothetical protein
MEHPTYAPTRDPQRLRAADGTVVSPPADWLFVPAGDPGLTRRLKAAGPVWIVAEKKGRKVFTRGLWAPATQVTTAQADLATERASPAYARKRAADAQRRADAQADYVEDFAGAVRSFLNFAPPFANQAEQLVQAVTTHATPVGSGTVARTERIPLTERVASAVIAWLRHQTTAYDRINVPRVRGARRELRRDLARSSHQLLDQHRGRQPHPLTGCPLCQALAQAKSA